jgi:hypothetical protein
VASQYGTFKTLEYLLKILKSCNSPVSVKNINISEVLFIMQFKFSWSQYILNVSLMRHTSVFWIVESGVCDVTVKYDSVVYSKIMLMCYLNIKAAMRTTDDRITGVVV